MDEEDQTLDQATAPIVDNDLDPPAETDGRPAALDRLPGASVHDLLETSPQPFANPFDSYDRPTPPKPASPHTKSANPFDAFDAVAQRQQTRTLDALPEFSLLKEAVRARDLTARIDDAVGRDDLARQARQSAATLDPDGRKAWLDWEAGDAAAQVEQWQNELRAIRDEHGSLEAAPPSANLPGIMDALQKAQSRHTIVSQMQEDAKLGIERTASPQMQAATARTIDEQELRLSYQQDVLDQAVNSPVRDPIAIENAKANVQFERAKLEKLRTVRDAGEQRPAIPGATGTGEFVRQFTVGAFATVPELLGGAAVRVGQDMGPGSGEALEAIGQLTRDFGKQAKRDTPAEASPNLLDLDWQKQSFFTDLKLYLAGKLGQGLGTSATVIGAAAVGGLPAAGATSVGMGVGQMQNAVEEAFAAQGLDIPPDKVAYNVYLLGTGVGLLESVTELWALKGFMGAGKEAVTKSLAASLAKGVAKGAAIEGITEGLQEILEIHGVADATGRAIDWTEARRRIIEATAAGAIPGAAMGGITARKPPKGGASEEPPRVEPVMGDTPATATATAADPTIQPEKVAPQAQTPEQAAPAAAVSETKTDAPATSDNKGGPGPRDIFEQDIRRAAQSMPEAGRDAFIASALDKYDADAMAVPFALQPGETFSDEDIDSVVETWRYVREQRRLPQPASLSEWLKANGGIVDHDEELKNMLGGRYNRRPGLVSSRGMSLDDATHAAWEAGYLEGIDRPEINDLLNALDDDLRGRKVVAAMDRERVAELEAVDRLEQDLADLGIRNVRTEDQIRAHFRQSSGGRSATNRQSQIGSGQETAPADVGRAQKAVNTSSLVSYLDSQGSLARSELPAMATKLGVTPEELPKLLEKAVADGVLRKTAGGQYRRATPTAEATYKLGSPQAAEAAIQQAIQEIRKALPKDVKIKTFDTVEALPAKSRQDAKAAQAQGGTIEGATVDGDVYLYSKALDPTAILGHEGWHALEKRGLVTPAERKVLAARIAKLPEMFDRARYEAAYAGRDNLADQIDEEAAAHMVEARIAGNDFGREINGILDRIVQFLERLANALTGKGFQTVDDVMAAFLSGEMAAREDLRSNPEVAPGVTRLARGTSEPPVSGFPTLRNTTMYAIKAFHGSPHDFDRFSMDRIGTGEGAQAYGFGLYFSQTLEVADSYRANLSARNMPTAPNKASPDVLARNAENLGQLAVANPLLVEGFGALDVEARADVLTVMRSLLQDREVAGAVVRLVPVDMVNVLGREQLTPQALLDNPAMLVNLLPVDANDSVASRVAAVDVLAPYVTFAAAERALPGSEGRALLQEALAARFASKGDLGHISKVPEPYDSGNGRLYEVKINAEPEQFLDWDKPLSQQPKAVIDLFDKVYADLSPEDRAKVQNSPGQHIYEGVGAKLGKPHRGDGTVGGLIAGLNRHDVATQTFRDAGIPGIRYLDQGSRGDGQGTYNFVVFDDNLIEITAKDGVPMSAKDKSDVMFALRSSGLDPSPEARKARAEEMGFDTSKVWYHVTDAEFDQFSNDVLGGNTARTADSEAALESARLGTWFTTEPERVADMTVSDIEGGRTIPAYVRGNFYDKDGTIDLEYVIDVLQKRLDKRGEGAAERWRNDLIKKGYDGIRVIDTEFGGESLIVFDPKNIRSVNAMFDPDKAGSANLMFALRDRLGFARNSPELRSMNALVRDLAFDLGITVRRGFKTTQSKIAKSAAKQAGDTLNAFYDPMTGVLRLQKFNDVSGVAEVAGNILKQRHGKAFQTAADRVNQAMKDELYHLNFERTQFPIRENNLAAMREELATIEAQGWMKDSMETQQRGATLRRDIPLREADLEAARAKIAALEVLTKEAPRVPEDMGAWFQTYLMNPQAASIDPFTDVFEAALDIVDPALLGKIEGAQQSVSAYAKANAAEVMTSMIVPSEIPGAWDRLTHDAERFGWKMALGMRLSDLYGAVYANDHPFYLMSLHLLRLHAKNTGNKIDLKAIDHPAKLWRISAQARAWANRDLDKGIRPADSVDHAGPSMMDVLTTALGANRRKAVDTGPGSRYRDFGAYLMARMGVERWTRYEAAKAAGELGQLREPYAVPKSIMITAVQDFEVKYPSFAAAAQMLYAFQRNLLTLQRDKGLISEETYQALQAEKNYVPSLRSFEDEKTGGSGQTAKKGEAAIQDVIKRFRGSQRDVIDPISSIALKVFKTRADIAVNDTIQKLLYLAEQAGPGGGLFAERLDARQAQAVQVDLRQALKNAAKEANLSENDRAALVDLASEMLGSNVTTTMFTQGLLRGGKGEPVVYMREAGKIVPIRLGKMGEGGHASARLGKQVWDLLNTYGETHTNFVLQMMALPAQIIRTMVVSHPSFMLANIIRDAPAAWGYDPQALPIWTQLVGSFDVIRGAEYVERYRSTAGMMGGEATQLFDQFLADHDVETLVRKGYRFASFNSFSNGISFLSDAFSLRNWPDKAFGATMGGIAGFSMAGPVGGVAGAVLGGSIGGKAMAAAGELTETATRSRLWKHAFGRAKAAGLGDVEAAAEAAYWAHAYGDYSRHGLKTDVVRKWVPFLNANLQANDAFFQRLLAKGDYGFEATKYVPGQVALWPLYKAGVLQLPATLTAKQREELAMSAWAWFSTMAVIGSASMVYALMYRDDDRIKMLPENLRANHWNIPLDDLARAIGTELPKEHRGKHFARIPKPFERAIVANTIERLTMEYARGNPRWLEHWLSDIYEVTKPPLMPTALDLPAQLLMNRDSFSGREIVPRQGAGQRMRSEMFDEYTSQFARWLGGQLDLAPQQVDFMIAKLGSTWGRDATRANIPGAPWFDPKAPTQGLDEKFIASRFLYKIGKGTEAEKAFREVMGGEDPLPRIWEKIAVPYNRLDAQAESYKFLKDRLRQDAKAMGRLDSMTASERGYALLEGHWQGSNAKYQQLHPMKRAETVSQLVSQMQKELIGDHSTAGKKGPRQTILDLSPDEKQAARDALTQYKAMEVYNALVLTGEKGWQNRGYLPAKGVLDELATGVPEIAAEFQRRLEKAHVLPFEGVRTIWPRVKEKLESQELLRRIKDKDTIGLGALLAAEYGEARFP